MSACADDVARSCREEETRFGCLLSEEEIEQLLQEEVVRPLGQLKLKFK